MQRSWHNVKCWWYLKCMQMNSLLHNVYEVHSLWRQKHVSEFNSQSETIQRSFSCTSNNKTPTISAPFAFVFALVFVIASFLLLQLYYPFVCSPVPNASLSLKFRSFSRRFSIFVLSLTLSLLVIKVAWKHFPKPNTLILGSFLPLVSYECH